MDDKPIEPVNKISAEPESGDNPRVVLFLGIALIFLIIGTTIGGFLFASSAGFAPRTIFAKLKSLTLAREKMLSGEADDRINLLLLGMGGVGHEGATLTDTIILAGIRPSDGRVGLLSIPRDLQVLLPGRGYQRINTVNAFAELETGGSGGAAVSNMISAITAQPIHYYVRLDFRAFQEIIDTIGGIEVDIERSFYDPFYPDENFGYAPVAFEQGLQRLNGERALKFVRSRHGTNGESGDFARARRQQKVLLAFKDRLLSFDVLLRPNRIKSILESLNDHIQTNIAFWEGMRLAQLLRDINTIKITNTVLDDAPGGVLVARNYNGAFVLEPKDSTWTEVRAVARELLDDKKPAADPDNISGKTIAPTADSARDEKIRPSPALAAVSPPAPLPDKKNETASALIELQNGTFINGLAARTAEKLEALGFKSVSLGNAPVRDVPTTLVYDLTGGTKSAELEKLKQFLGAIDGKGEPLKILSKGDLNFLVILGQDAAE